MVISLKYHTKAKIIKLVILSLKFTECGFIVMI